MDRMRLRLWITSAAGHRSHACGRPWSWVISTASRRRTSALRSCSRSQGRCRPTGWCARPAGFFYQHRTAPPPVFGSCGSQAPQPCPGRVPPRPRAAAQNGQRHRHAALEAAGANCCAALGKQRQKFSVVIAAISAALTPWTSATRRWYGDERRLVALARCGTGARLRRVCLHQQPSRGMRAAMRRISSEFLKVRMPEKDTMKPRSTPHCATASPDEKQCSTAPKAPRPAPRAGCGSSTHPHRGRELISAGRLARRRDMGGNTRS